MRHVPVGCNAVIGAVSAHGRDNDAVGEVKIGKPQRREQSARHDKSHKVAARISEGSAIPGLSLIHISGDELQGLKKGVVELADMIAVNKADGDNLVRAKAAAAEYRAALHILTPRSPNWSPPVVTYSAMTGDGIAALWAHVLDHREKLTAAGELASRRGEQQVKWMWAMLEERLFAPLRSDRTLKAALPRIEADVAAGRLAANAAVEEIAGMLGR